MKNEIFALINKFLDFLTGKTGKIYLNYPAEDETGFIFIWILLVLISVFVVVKAVHGKRIWPLMVVTAVIMSGVLSGFIKPGAWLVGFALIFALLLYCRNFKATGLKKQLGAVAACIVILVICSAVAIVPAILSKDFSTTDRVDSIKNKVHRYVYDCGDNAMPEGRLSDLGPRSQSEKPALELTAESFGKLYMKGVVGEVYTGNGWIDLSAESKIKSEDLFYWLHKEGFYGQTIISRAAESVEAENEVELIIKNVSACRKYQYLPYGLSSTDTLNEKMITDATAFATEEEQTIKLTAGSVPQWYEIALQLFEKKETELVEEFLKKEQSYSQFVYENYLQLTNGALGVCRRTFGESHKERNLSEILNIVMSTLEDSLDYNEIISTPSGGNDFFQYTMEQKKQGYDVHYATAATLMLRYFGVPARYVEGYFLSADEAAEYENAGTIVLDESHAHAWPEIYLDGIGWIPFEVTPGYIDDEEIKAVFSAIEGAVEESNYTEKTYAENNLVYTPPKRMESEQEVTLPDSRFSFSIWDIVSYLWILPVIILVVFLVIILRRRGRLIFAMKSIQKMDNGDAIAAEYAYAAKLIKLGALDNVSGQEQILSLNNEAIFSNHEMTDEQRQEVWNFRNKVLNLCKSKWNFRQRFYYHYILWIYK